MRARLIGRRWSIWTRVCAALLMLSGILAAQESRDAGAPKIRRPGLPPKGDRLVVVVWQRLMNRSHKPIPKGGVRLALPGTGAGQWIYELHFPAGEPDEIRLDRFGNRIACWDVENLKPGGSLGCCFVARVDLFPRRYGLDQPDAVPELSESERKLYLADGPGYRLSDPRLQEFLKEADPKGSDLDKAKALSVFVSKRLNYVLDGRWDPAPVVLERKTGSCSEFTYSFIALARLAGLPTRYAGGYRVRSRTNVSVDAVHHRWPEVYLRDYGWVALDPTADRRRPPYRFGNLPGNLMHAYAGDHSDLIGSSYTGSCWREGKLKIGGDRFAFFFRGVSIQQVMGMIRKSLDALNRGECPALDPSVPGALAAVEPMLFSGNEASMMAGVDLVEAVGERSATHVLRAFAHLGPSCPARVKAAGIQARWTLPAKKPVKKPAKQPAKKPAKAPAGR